jgi:hypothetical protein
VCWPLRPVKGPAGARHRRKRRRGGQGLFLFSAPSLSAAAAAAATSPPPPPPPPPRSRSLPAVVAGHVSGERASGRAAGPDRTTRYSRGRVRSWGRESDGGGPAIYDRVAVVAVACVRARARLPAGRASCGRGGGEFRRRRRRAGARDPPERDVSEKRPRGIAFASTGTFSPLYCHWRCPAGPGRAGPRDAIALPAS